MRYSAVFGFFLLFLMVLQLISGIMLILGVINNYIVLEYFHAVNSSLLFFFVLLHIYKNIYTNINVGSNIRYPIISGWLIFILLSITCFSGYVIPWGQVSYWGVQVVTNILNIFPLVGDRMRLGVIGGPTLMDSIANIRFKGAHVVLGIVIWIFIAVHIVLVHSKRSVQYPIVSILDNFKSLYMFPSVYQKDFFSLLFVSLIIIFLFVNYSWIFDDCTNKLISNPINTPLHVVPAWYFLPSFASLKYTSSKLLGIFISLFILNSWLFFFVLKYNK